MGVPIPSQKERADPQVMCPVVNVKKKKGGEKREMKTGGNDAQIAGEWSLSGR